MGLGAATGCCGEPGPGLVRTQVQGRFKVYGNRQYRIGKIIQENQQRARRIEDFRSMNISIRQNRNFSGKAKRIRRVSAVGLRPLANTAAATTQSRATGVLDDKGKSISADGWVAP